MIDMQNMQLDNLAMMVVSCDAYTELGKNFFELQERYMGWFDGPRYFINESRSVDYPGVHVIHVGTDVNWSKKVELALQSIPEKYILFMLEDYFIGENVSRDRLCDAFDLIQQYGLSYYRITAIPKIHKKCSLSNFLSPIPSNVRYGINLQAAIFERTFLERIISGPDRSAWEVEIDLLKKVTTKYEYDIPGCVLDNRNIIDIHNGVIKGKWVPSTIKFFKKQGYMIEIGNRPMLSMIEVFRNHLVGGISNILPAGFTKKLKHMLIRLGFRFVSEN